MLFIMASLNVWYVLLKRRQQQKWTNEKTNYKNIFFSIVFMYKSNNFSMVTAERMFAVCFMTLALWFNCSNLNVLNYLLAVINFLQKLQLWLTVRCLIISCETAESDDTDLAPVIFLFSIIFSSKRSMSYIKTCPLQDLTKKEEANLFLCRNKLVVT